MDLDTDHRSTWSHQIQATSYGAAVDTAILVLGKQLNKHIVPDEVCAVGPFPITMREGAVNRYNNFDGVWDVTIRWY